MLGLATAASRTTNPVLLLLVIGVCVLVVSERHDPATVNPLPAFLVIGAVLVAFRIVMTALLGNGIVGETVVVTLPSVPLPDWAASVRIGGTVTLESLLYAAYDALRLAAVLACLGAANALAARVGCCATCPPRSTTSDRRRRRTHLRAAAADRRPRRARGSHAPRPRRGAGCARWRGSRCP